MSTNMTYGSSKPPPLHEREDVFEVIATCYTGGNDLDLWQSEFRGACKLMTLTAIPKRHDELLAAVSTSARKIYLTDDADVHALFDWIKQEKVRNTAKVAENREAVLAGAGTFDNGAEQLEPPAQVADIRVGENDIAHAG